MPQPNGPRAGRNGGHKRNTHLNQLSKMPTPAISPGSAVGLGQLGAQLTQNLFTQLSELRMQKGLLAGAAKIERAGIAQQLRGDMVTAESSAIERGIFGGSTDIEGRIEVQTEAEAARQASINAERQGRAQLRMQKIGAYNDYVTGLLDLQSRRAAEQADMTTQAMLTNAVLNGGGDGTGGAAGTAPPNLGPGEANKIGSRIIESAFTQVGAPYVFGDLNPFGKAGGPGAAFDCSGFVKWAVERATGGKMVLPHMASLQQNAVNHINKNQLQPGDLLFFNYGRKAAGVADHVAIYIGNGRMIDTSSPSRTLGPRAVDWTHFLHGGAIGARIGQFSSGGVTVGGNAGFTRGQN